MLRPLMVSGFALGLVWQGTASATACDSSYEKTIPYSQPIVEKVGKLSVSNLITLRYDCSSFLAEATGGVEAGFFGVKADLINGKVAADTTAAGSHLRASALVLGYEIAHQDLDVGTVYRHTFRPDHDIDLAQTTTIQIGPVPVPVRYGIQGNAELAVDAGARNFGVELAATPRVHATGYVQSNVDLEIVYGAAKGQLLLADTALRNAIGVHFSPNAEQPSIKFDAVGDIELEALQGSVTGKLAARLGKDEKEYSKTLVDWQGYNVNRKMYAESGKIADLPAVPAKSDKKLARK
ncbi:MAG: type II and III secretion system protein [Deltaproteobacteria bacterium]|nr:type II and III secretion system protein [Deltaproteobacteria bacterium]